MRIFHKARSIRRAIFSVLLCAVPLLAGLVVSAADEAETSTSTPSSSTGQRPPVLHSGVEDKEQMQPSVKLLLTPPQSATPHPIQSTVNQFAGANSYTPGNQAPTFPQPLPQKSDTGASSQVTPAPVFAPWKFLATPPSKPPAKWDYTATPRNGVMNWTPGHGTSVVTPSRRLSSMQTDLQWSSTAPNLLVRPSGRSVDGRANVIQPSTGRPQLKAVQKSLPGTQLAPPASWEDWYQRVAKAIYAQWRQQTEIGPGSATVLITVFNTHDVDCKISDFSPAGDAKRDAASESKFRNASLRSVTSLNGASVWEFPVAATKPKKISFDMQFKHEVGGVPGCQVVHMHDNKSMTSLQDR
jgi:hypothetical protein